MVPVVVLAVRSQSIRRCQLLQHARLDSAISICVSRSSLGGGIGALRACLSGHWWFIAQVDRDLHQSRTVTEKVSLQANFGYRLVSFPFLITVRLASITERVIYPWIHQMLGLKTSLKPRHQVI